MLIHKNVYMSLIQDNITVYVCGLYITIKQTPFLAIIKLTLTFFTSASCKVNLSILK